MADYIVGDVQGCFSELQALLEKVNFSTQQDTLYLAGDIVARGNDSLATLHFVKSLGDSAKIVLGNHDLHLLAINAGLKKAKPADKLNDILTAPDKDDLLHWLAKQPLLRQLNNENAYISHAGISPQWNIEQAKENAQFAEQKLQSSQRNYWLAQMYGEKPNNWLAVSNDIERFRYTINSFTRMRFCFKDGSLEFNHKLSPDNSNITENNLLPWYELAPALNENTWIFGHWAALMGKTMHKNVYALDTGCVWGNYLTMLRWQDKRLFTEKAHQIN